MTTTITFLGRLVGLNSKGGLLRSHWSAKKAAMEKFMWAVKAQTSYRHPASVRMELIRYSTSAIECDFDNLVSTGKGPVFY